LSTVLLEFRTGVDRNFKDPAPLTCHYSCYCSPSQ